MHNGIFPIFTRGRVLKKESIEYLRDFPYDLASVAYGDYSDGILFGFSVNVKDRRIILSKGALKFKGDIIIVPENAADITEYGRFLHMKLIIGECSETEDFKIRPIAFEIDGRRASSENEMELGRFCLNTGAVLRCKYDSFHDLRTPENTLDVTHVSYAGIGSPTLHPLVLKEYAGALLAGSSEMADTVFALMCLNSGVIHKDSIQWYIAKKTNSSYAEYTLDELYEKLADMLFQQRSKNVSEKPRARRPIVM